MGSQNINTHFGVFSFSSAPEICFCIRRGYFHQFTTRVSWRRYIIFELFRLGGYCALPARSLSLFHFVCKSRKIFSGKNSVGKWQIAELPDRLPGIPAVVPEMRLHMDKRNPGNHLHTSSNRCTQLIHLHADGLMVFVHVRCGGNTSENHQLNRLLVLAN